MTAIPVRAMRNRDLNIIPIVPPPLLMQSECHGELDQRSGLVQKALINTTPALRATPPRLRRVFGSSSDYVQSLSRRRPSLLFGPVRATPKLEKGVLPDTMMVNVIVDYANNENTTR